MDEITILKRQLAREIKARKTAEAIAETKTREIYQANQDLEISLQKLKASKLYIENILHSMSDTLIVIDLDSTIRRVNHAILNLLGYEEHELIGKSIDELLVEEQKLFSPIKLEELQKRTLFSGIEITYLAKDGRKFFMLFSASIMHDDDGKTQGIVCVAQDISELKRVRNELQNAYDELEQRVKERTKDFLNANKELQLTTAQLIQSEKLSAIGEISSGITHEIKQPLNVIKILNQSLLRDISKNSLEEEELKEDLEQVNEQVNKMAEIIDHMRVFSRGTNHNDKQNIDVNNVIESGLKFFSQQLKVHNVLLVKELHDNLPNIFGNPIQLEQVLMNLITNARNAVEGSEKTDKQIRVRSYGIAPEISPTHRYSVSIEVSDTGGGIPVQLEDKIFKQFFTTKPPGEGTGLGLSISQKIVKDHDGVIELENKVGEGATFRVILPVSS